MDKKTHRRLFRQANKTLDEVDPRAITDEQREALRSGFVHGKKLIGVEQILDWYERAQQPFNLAGEWSLLAKNYRGVLAYAESELGEDHPCTLTRVHNLAHLLTRQGEYEEVDKLFERAIGDVDWENASDIKDLESLFSVNDFAAMLAKRGQDYFDEDDLDSAEETFKKGESLFEKAIHGIKQVIREQEDPPDEARVRLLHARDNFFQPLASSRQIQSYSESK